MSGTATYSKYSGFEDSPMSQARKLYSSQGITSSAFLSDRWMDVGGHGGVCGCVVDILDFRKSAAFYKVRRLEVALGL